MLGRLRSTTSLAFGSAFLFALSWPAFAWSQNALTLDEVATRLQRVEQENAQLQQQLTTLQQELVALRQQGAAASPSTIERVDALGEQVTVNTGRLAEQDQVKVETTQRAPLRLTGMVLFNAFRNGKYSGPLDYPGIAQLAATTPNSGGTLRQSVFGIMFEAPRAVLGGQFHGELMMDLQVGLNTSPLTNQPRLRTASIEGRWKDTAVLAGQEKLIFAPRDPNSLAQVLVSPLTGAGNLYGWRPQVRVEQLIRLGERQDLDAQFGVTQTLEDNSTTFPADIMPTLELRRPGPEGHVQLTHRFDDAHRFEIASGFHVSDTHVARTVVPSRIVSMDWFVNPVSRLELSGFLYRGKNVAHVAGRRATRGEYKGG